MNRAKKLIKEFEGCRLEAYKCSAGVPTIGYGHTSGVKMGDRITQQRADELFDEDFAKFEREVRRLTAKVQLSNTQAGALTSFAFNLGVGALKDSTLLKRVLSNPADPDIRNQFMRWVNAGGKQLEGLKRRRKAEADLYFEYVLKV